MGRGENKLGRNWGTDLSDDLGGKAVVGDGGVVGFIAREIVAPLGSLEVSTHAGGGRSGRGHGGRGGSAMAEQHDGREGRVRKGKGAAKTKTRGKSRGGKTKERKRDKCDRRRTATTTAQQEQRRQQYQ